MPPRLPQVSGQAVISLLEKLGYKVVRQRGSHARLTKDSPVGQHHITIPLHKALAKGTLNDILSTVSIRNGIPKEELMQRLK